MRFRPHRGSFAESMAELEQVASLEELQAVLSRMLGQPQFVRFSKSEYDPRKGWDAATYYVIVVDPDGQYSVAGMTDGDSFGDIPIERPEPPSSNQPTPLGRKTS